MRVMRRLVIGLVVFLDVGVDVGELLAHVVADDPRAERGHGRLERCERFFGAVRRALIVPAAVVCQC